MMAEIRRHAAKQVCCALFQSTRWRLILSCIGLLFLASMALVLLNEHNVDYSLLQSGKNVQYFEIEIAEPEYETILLWTPWFGMKLWFFNSNGSAPFQGCPESLCSLSYERSSFNDSSMVLFHSRDIDLKELPQEHLPAQYYIFMSMESPMNTYIATNGTLDYMFNMSMTYMKESDIIVRYGAVARRSRPEPTENYVKLKDKGILWYVSNCYTDDSKIRFNFVKDLRRYVDVDVYGMCGAPDPCMINKTPTFNATCVAEMKKRYRFYLSMENSLCTDYITEKFWSAMTHGMVPIVMGASLEEYRRVAPPSSFIHVNQFSSVEELAAYLLYLIQNDDAYNHYLAWKHDYEIIMNPYSSGEVACQLCSLAHMQKRRHQPAFSLNHWWSRERLCRNSW